MNLKDWGTIAFFGAVFALFAACTFDYGDENSGDSTFPDITMENLEYYRVKKGLTIAKMDADIGERYEKRHLMELKNFNFEQYDTTNGNIDAMGMGGNAAVEMDTGNIRMTGNVHIKVESEDMIIDTESLDWKDKSKTLTGPSNGPVHIEKSDGTDVRGVGFSADLRSRTWLFSSNVEGVYNLEDTEDEGAEPDDQTQGETSNENNPESDATNIEATNAEAANIEAANNAAAEAQ
jgi:LPS export ABC transporter protein LptC